MSEDQQWYTNKDLFEKIDKMRDDFIDIRSEMQETKFEMRETREIIKKYNGLREDIGQFKDQVSSDISNVNSKVNDLVVTAKNKDKFSEAFRAWGGWIFALFSFAIMLYNFFIK